MNATVERFLQYLRYERNLSWRTVVTYRGNLVQWEEYMTVAGRPLDVISVTAADIRQWLVSRSAQGDGPATLRLKLQALRSLYRYLLRCGEVAVNPAAQVELAKLPKPLPKFVRDKTVDAVLFAYGSSRLLAFFGHELLTSGSTEYGSPALDRIRNIPR